MNKSALVTGAARGIGRSTAEYFLENGWSVVAHYHQSEERAKTFGENDDVSLLQADLSQESGIRKVIATIQEENPETLVNNAGIAVSSETVESSAETWGSIMTINGLAPFFLTQKFSEIVSSGTVVNVSSIRGLRYSTRPGIAEYCASKSTVENFTASLAQQYAPEVRINAVAPGFTKTDMTSGIDEETRQEVVEKTPMNRFGNPDEIAQAIYFLSSERSSFCVGETLVVDGGYSLAD